MESLAQTRKQLQKRVDRVSLRLERLEDRLLLSNGGFELIPNLAITTDPGVQQMPSIAVNPLDSDHLVISYMDYSLVGTGYAGIGVAVSQDGGDTWQQMSIDVPDPFEQGAANPITRFDDQGNVYVSFMAATFLGTQPPQTNPDYWDRWVGFESNNGIFVAGSDDGGLTWSEPVAVVSHLFTGDEVFFEVTPDLAIDTSPVLPSGQANPYYGSLYVVWARLYPVGQFPGHPEINGGTDIMVAVSRDNGQNWETQLQDLGGVQAAVIQEPENTAGLPGLGLVDQARVAIGPEGEVYVSNFGAGTFTIHVSVDGAATFEGPDRSTGERTVFGTGFGKYAAAHLQSSQFRTNAVRAIAADPTRPGYVYAVETIEVTDASGNQLDAADVFFGRSTDYGTTWETTSMVGPYAASVLNDDNWGQSATGVPSDVVSGQAMPRLTVDAAGTIGIVWYDTRHDPVNHLLDVFGTFSTDGGFTFSPNSRITDVPFDADQGVFTDAVGELSYYIGDFIGLAMANGVACVAWTDTRAGNQDIFVASFVIDPPPEAPNDRYEPNQASITATDLGQVVQDLQPKLAAAMGDEDWFLLEAAATGELVATALFDDPTIPSAGAVQLQLWDGAGTALLATGAPVLGNEGDVVGLELRYSSLASESYLVRVIGPGAGAETVGYSLGLQSLTADLGMRVFSELSGTVSTGGSLYLVQVASSGSIDVRLSGGANVQGDLDLHILDAGTFEILASGRPGPILTATHAEPNDSIGDANNTMLSQPGEVRLFGTIGDGAYGVSSGDYDFFSFHAAAGLTVSVELSAAAVGSSLDGALLLYDGFGALLQVVDGAGTGGTESLSFVAATADTYYVAVLGWQSWIPADPFVPGTGNGAGSTGDYRLTITAAALGPGGYEEASLSVNRHDRVLLLVSGPDGSTGDFELTYTNLDQFTTPEPHALLFPAGPGSSSVATADLDGDGDPDVVAANALSNTISVLLGNGDGTFQAPRQFAVGAFAVPNPVSAGLPVFGREVAIADLDDDAIPDVVVTNYDSSDVSVLLGRGDGTFEPQRRFDATPAPLALDVGDLNGDLVPDLVVADSPIGTHTQTVAVLLGRGDGSFLPQRTFEIETTGVLPFTGLRLADLDADGVLDLIVSGENSPGINVYRGNGDGTFAYQGRFDAGREAPDSEAADLNGDGALDIVVASSSEENELSVLFGNGDGTFTDIRYYYGGQHLMDVEVVDFGSQIELPDGSVGLGPPDGAFDLVVAASGVARAVGVVGGPEVVVLPAILDEHGELAGFGSPQLLAEAERPIALDVADVNNDGAPDLVVVDRDGVVVIFGDLPTIAPNDTPATARDLGTAVHLVDQTQTIVPGRQDAYYRLTVPTEALGGAGDEVIDFSGFFEAEEGAGLQMEVFDSSAVLLGSGERFRIVAPQGEELLLHVFGEAGAFTPVIDVLPQVVSVEAQALLPGVGAAPGGPTTSLVVTFQGDRLDPAAAEEPGNWTVTWLGPDGLAGGGDDEVIPVGGAGVSQPIVYNPGANVEPSSGLTYPTAVRQTVNLLFAEPLPAGSYVVGGSVGVQSAPFNESEMALLTDVVGFTGHPVVSVAGMLITEGAQEVAADVVMAPGELGDLGIFEAGTAFLTQFHGDMGALLDSLLTARGDDATIPEELANQVLARFAPGVGPVGERSTLVLVVILDPVPFHLVDMRGDRVSYDLDAGAVTSQMQNAFVEVGRNVEAVVVSGASGRYLLQLAQVPQTQRSRGVVVAFDAFGDHVYGITGDMRSGVTEFAFRVNEPDPVALWIAMRAAGFGGEGWLSGGVSERSAYAVARSQSGSAEGAGAAGQAAGALGSSSEDNQGPYESVYPRVQEEGQKVEEGEEEEPTEQPAEEAPAEMEEQSVAPADVQEGEEADRAEPEEPQSGAPEPEVEGAEDGKEPEEAEGLPPEAEEEDAGRREPAGEVAGVSGGVQTGAEGHGDVGQSVARPYLGHRGKLVGGVGVSPLESRVEGVQVPFALGLLALSRRRPTKPTLTRRPRRFWGSS